jgi:carboxyl-terminal processing protease
MKILEVKRPPYGLILCGLLSLVFPHAAARGQGFSNFNQASARIVLKTLKGDIEKNYYDASYRGMDLDALFKEAEEKVAAATSTSQLLGIIAQTLVNLNDSHTFFLPPSRQARTEYGWQMQMVGDESYVIAVKPGSDAEAKGLKPGDQVVTIDGYEPTRENSWLLRHFYYSLRPQPGMRLIVRSPEGDERQLDVMARVTPGKRVLDLTTDDIWDVIRDAESESRVNRHRFMEWEKELIIWKMPQFDLDSREVDDQMRKVSQFKSLILDLRGNGGGSVAMLERMTGFFFERDITIAERKGRKKMDPMEAKTRGKDVFMGDLAVLVDSRSGSASEIFSRMIQLEQRGTVIGDRTSGAVMQSRQFSHQLGAERVIFYGASITNADVIMSDGNSIEHAGVTPDELLLPSAADIAAGHDPVLARAAEMLGMPMSAERAGALFPIEWER